MERLRSNGPELPVLNYDAFLRTRNVTMQGLKSGEKRDLILHDIQNVIYPVIIAANYESEIAAPFEENIYFPPRRHLPPLKTDINFQMRNLQRVINKAIQREPIPVEHIEADRRKAEPLQKLLPILTTSIDLLYKPNQKKARKLLELRTDLQTIAAIFGLDIHTGENQECRGTLTIALINLIHNSLKHGITSHSITTSPEGIHIHNVSETIIQEGEGYGLPIIRIMQALDANIQVTTVSKRLPHGRFFNTATVSYEPQTQS